MFVGAYSLSCVCTYAWLNVNALLATPEVDKHGNGQHVIIQGYVKDLGLGCLNRVYPNVSQVHQP